MCGRARSKCPLKSRPAERRPRGQCCVPPDKSGPHSLIQEVAGKELRGAENHFGLKARAHERREGALYTQSWVGSRTREEAIHDMGQIEFCLP